MSTRCLRLIPVFCLCVFFGQAQQSEPANRRITLDVVVTDKSGKPVPGLQQQDFTLLDNRQPQKLLSFTAVEGGAQTADPPLDVVLVVDEVNTAFSRVSYARQELEKFLKRDGGELPRPVSLAVLSDKGLAMSNLSTRDGNALAAELSENKAGLRTVTRSQGIYGADDRVGLSLNALHQLADY